MGGGIRIYGASTSGNVIQGNYFGTDRTGTAPLPNDYAIKIASKAHDNTIGPNNVIAYNSGDGVWVDGAGTNANTITQNSMHSNGGLRIDLTNDGNDLLPSSIISSTTCASAVGSTLITTTVELFTGPDDEGKTYLTTVSPDGLGNWNASGFIAEDMYLTATAMDGAGNTHQFSAVAGCGNHAYVPLVAKNYQPVRGAPQDRGFRLATAKRSRPQPDQPPSSALGSFRLRVPAP